jgi:hypothetical protein
MGTEARREFDTGNVEGGSGTGGVIAVQGPER